ncbi:ABC transporter permease [Saccharopolyspora phatthalungensis]|uniref:Peptide/nickel transport system permease protein n=1 Tax=Saccharopolyspora phatthalungensis TaxID=664693 RepID=A0A840QFX1_9PSEU|nr:ABC transporter permease [Saccharopolyspora phatthalungensis]MBB5158987.1 peptide/nickel transport system permease protein [Saccharopolyspora phatthalungensis]
MIARAATRLVIGVGLLALLSLLVYVGVDLLPGDAATTRLGANATPENIAIARHRLGLDRPVLVRYGDWLAGLVHGDLGRSVTGKPVTEMLSDRVGNSALLAGAALVLLVPVSLGAGLLAASSRWGRFVSAGALVLVSVPEFAVAGVLALLFAVSLRWLPAVSFIPAGDSPLEHPTALVLPVLSLLAVGFSYAVRAIRAATIAAVGSAHVEFLRLNGASSRTVLRAAVLPAVLPVAVQVWLVIGVSLLGGGVLVEKVFGYPGIGELLVASVQSGDLPVVQALVLLLAAMTLVALALADLAVLALTPRLRTWVVSA